MPIYEFLCDHCNHSFEKMTSISDRDAKTKCPSCGSQKTARKLSTVGVGKTPSPTSSAPARAHPAACGCCSNRRSCGIN